MTLHLRSLALHRNQARELAQASLKPFHLNPPFHELANKKKKSKQENVSDSTKNIEGVVLSSFTHPHASPLHTRGMASPSARGSSPAALQIDRDRQTRGIMMH